MLAEMQGVVQREQGTGNRNGGCRVDYEIVHVVPAAPFLNECHCGASIAPKDYLRVALKEHVAAASRPPLWRRPKGLASRRRRRRYIASP